MLTITAPRPTNPRGMTPSMVFASGVWFMNRFGTRVVGLRADDVDDGDDDAMFL